MFDPNVSPERIEMSSLNIVFMLRMCSTTGAEEMLPKCCSRWLARIPWKDRNFFYIFWWCDLHWSGCRVPTNRDINLKILSMRRSFLFSNCLCQISRKIW
jgi:hypothetical protein